MPSLHDKPTDYTIVLVGFLLGREWMEAEEIRRGIAQLGFRKPSSQWVTGRLLHMCREECPRFVRRQVSWTAFADEYRVTSWAATGLENTWRGVTVSAETRALLPTPKPEERI